VPRPPTRRRPRSSLWLSPRVVPTGAHVLRGPRSTTVFLTWHTHNGIASIRSNDDVFYSSVTFEPLITKGFMKIAHINEDDAVELLNNVNWRVLSVRVKRGLTQKLLKRWLGKTRSSVQCVLKTVMFRVLAFGSG